MMKNTYKRIIFGSLVVNYMLSAVIGYYCASETPEWPLYTYDEEECPKRGDSTLFNPNIPWGIEGRAWYTLPQELEIRTSTIPNSGDGVYSRTFIPVNTWLGEYEGEVVYDDDLASSYSYKMFHNETHTHYIDAGDVRTSAWTRFLNCPRHIKERTVLGVYCLGKVLIIASRNIYPGEELLLYYGDDYARLLGIDTKSFA